MTNRRNQIEIENVHNLIHHVEIESLFVFFQNFNRTVLILTAKSIASRHTGMSSKDLYSIILTGWIHRIVFFPHP